MNEEIQNLLTDYYNGEMQFKGNCQMDTENFIQSEVSSPNGAKFKPETKEQVMETIFDVTKAGQLITKNIHIPLDSAFWNKDEFNDLEFVTFSVDRVTHSLILTFPVFIKDFKQPPLSLFEIETIPVPIPDKNRQADSYSQVRIHKDDRDAYV